VYWTPDEDTPVAPAGLQNAPGVMTACFVGVGVGVGEGVGEGVGVGVGEGVGVGVGDGVGVGVGDGVGVAVDTEGLGSALTKITLGREHVEV
jgi:hypothetical protein